MRKLTKIIFVFLILNLFSLAIYTGIKEMLVAKRLVPLKKELAEIEKKVSKLEKELGKYRDNTLQTPEAIKIIQSLPSSIAPKVSVFTSSKADDIKEKKRYYYVTVKFDGEDLKKSIVLFLTILNHPLQYKIPRIEKGRIDVIFFQKLDRKKDMEYLERRGRNAKTHKSRT